VRGFSLFPLLPDLAVVGFYASALALLTLVLAFRVTWLRLRHGIGLGDGGREDLARAIRVHGNAVEYVPLGLVLLTLDALGGSPLVAVEIAGALLFLGRLAHAYGLSQSRGRSPGRFVGTLSTWLSYVLMVGLLLTAVYTRG
jgi:uncharacterized membrane protein YecN with MAPEG domain